MRFLPSWTAVVVLLLVGCNTPPPQPKVEWTPATGRAVAGETIEVRATKPFAQKQEVFEFKWTMEGACAGSFDDDTAWKATYQVPADCEGGTLRILLDAKTRQGVTQHRVEFTIQAVAAAEDRRLLPVRVSPMPATWEPINTYEANVVEKTKERRNDRGAYFGTWTYRDGRCQLVQGADGDEQVLDIVYSLPHADLSACGYFEYIEGAPGEAQKVDISAFAKVGFIARTKDGNKVAIRLELVEFDKFANYNQGIVSQSPTVLVDGEWRRFEVDLQQLARTWDLSSSKSIGFRVDAKDDNVGKGTIQLDNFVLIKPE